ncbi:MAG: hypothetical protein NW201_04620, partial [Gemmatimonadales bacterium]|nr:hypothetical protein [Gemmatimonadales bacterium]
SAAWARALGAAGRALAHPALPRWLPLGAPLAYAALAWGVFDARPLIIDEIAQVWQARQLADGRLWAPLPAHPEFTASAHVVDHAGRRFAQFPVGGPALLALGTLAHAEWLVDPLLAGVMLLALAALLARVPALTPAERGGTLVVAALAPFFAFMAATHMNHVGALALALLGVWATVAAFEAPGARPLLTGLGGLAFGAAAAVRPLDALAYAAPAAAWHAWRLRRGGRAWAEALAALAGVALPLALVAWVNRETTGSATTFGYTLLWGADHGLGFHRAPWGPVHTPARGLELASLALLRLNRYLFELPVPSLLPVAATLLLLPSLGRVERWLLASALLLAAGYFCYWHDGFFPGPRFHYALLPALALAAARAPGLVGARLAGATGADVRHGLSVAGIAAIAIGAGTLWPARAAEYARFLLTPRWDAAGAARAAGVRDALVLVRESWGAQLLARLWALGVGRAEAELLYRAVDACRLEGAVTALEAASVRGEAAAVALRPLLADSAAVGRSPFSSDDSEGFQPGVPYGPACAARLRDDAAGFTLHAPLLLADDGNRWVRDLQARDSLVLAAEPSRPVFLLRPPSADVGLAPRFEPLARDSLLAAWRAGR